MFSVLNHLPQYIKLKKYKLIFLILISTILDLLGVGIIIPLFALIINENYFQNIQKYFVISESFIVVIISILVVVIFLLKNLFSIYLERFKSKYLHEIFLLISKMILKSYIEKGIIYFNEIGSSSIFKNIYHVPFYYSTKVLMSYFLIIAEVLLSFILFTFLIFYNFKVFLILIIIILPLFFIYNTILKKITVKNGNCIDDISPKLHDSVNNFSFGFKEIILFQKEDFYSIKLFSFFKEYNKLNIERNILLILPNKFLDIIISLSLVSVILISFLNKDENSNIMMLIFSFGVIALRLIPSINKINGALNFISLYSYTIPIIKNNIKNSNNSFNPQIDKTEILFNNRIKLVNISKSFNNNPILENINIEIKKGSITGFYGFSGSGKSTLASIIKQIIIQDSGSLYVDDLEIKKYNIRSWQKKIGFVSQSNFIFKGTILENIAFGQNISEIDIKTVELVLDYVNLNDFNSNKGHHYILEENGSNISGGQIQRIALARALYSGAEVLILDEFTSSLDKHNEVKMLKIVKKLKKLNKTIILISHNQSTLDICDNLLEIKSLKFNSKT
jgi:ATP-binding cassette, subfamily B, bacterial PglK